MSKLCRPKLDATECKMWTKSNLLTCHLAIFKYTTGWSNRCSVCRSMASSKNSPWGDWVRQRCYVYYVTSASNCWARSAILAAGKGREGQCFYFFTFFNVIHFPLSPWPFLSSPLLSALFSLSLGNDTKWHTRVDVSLNPNSIKIQIYRINMVFCIVLTGNICWPRWYHVQKFQ